MVAHIEGSEDSDGGGLATPAAPAAPAAAAAAASIPELPLSAAHATLQRLVPQAVDKLPTGARVVRCLVGGKAKSSRPAGSTLYACSGRKTVSRMVLSIVLHTDAKGERRCAASSCARHSRHVNAQLQL